MSASFEETTLTVGLQGQIALPNDVLQYLGAQAGSKLVGRKLPNGRVEIQLARPEGRIADAFGMLKREGQRPISIDEMNEIIERGWAGEL
ncbi:hypothetical protein [Sphingomonas sp. PR090111-T3T-6A]|uniref:hypothetical protein n=1 Tax=Sphingomonas sp. PR090111-T3T-6A TaxID=685778 RepID=UPI000382D1A6|nr:hypothetical protein [Sphingomonas sp. PR090111-T3T-6A]